ncbi:hypothetical protein SAMN05216275_101245 [Streptosporangium canum]|uniref:Uncharacterized protein n=1 Tax=Streptosporangium canum TaxID=324952 RepID=A0A1I3FLY7_9ACTN|nr:hypothetical protein [Streptosporangium canum]SFI12233.1 hypothetical protein SAMN05216275_101245 [Streptosporangium canum]
MSQPPPQAQNYAQAARRHYDDAVYLHNDGRLPNADHHYGFSVECALKSLLLRYLNATMASPNGMPSTIDASGRPKKHGHLPGIWSDVAILAHGRSGSTLAGVLTASAPFATWDVADRYHGNPPLGTTTVNQRKAAATQILALHEQALIIGVLQ